MLSSVKEYTMLNWLLDFFDNRTFGAQRSSDWAKLSRDFIKKNGSLCRMGMHRPTLLNPLATHHIKSFHEFPALENEPSNWVVLCWLHHFVHAHLKNYRKSNPDILAECDALNNKIMNKV